ncbi:MAG: 4Fe-4S binding protein [Firmicutes bacterium]|nr:4Fe-4S binding protein [Bacillota bacterium]
MSSIETSLCGVRLSTPFVLASGPLSFSAEALVRATKAGAGAVVTKTIRAARAVNPTPHMVRSSATSLINCELWSDLPPEAWIDEEIPRAKSAGCTLIASIGHTTGEAQAYARRAAGAGADMIELVSYEKEDMVPMVGIAAGSGVPVLAKLSPNWTGLPEVARECIRAGASGITAADSLGPALRVDIRSGRPLLGSRGGCGWLSGAAIKPIALRVVAEIALENEVDIVGVGGVMTAEDAVEMLMAGATAVGVCSAPIMHGLEVFGRLNSAIASLLDTLGYGSPAAASRAALAHLRGETKYGALAFEYAAPACKECRRCVVLCPYRARTLENKVTGVNEALCRNCGLCASVCPTGALRLAGYNHESP